MTEPQWDILTPPSEIMVGRFAIQTKKVTWSQTPSYPVFALSSAGQSQRVFVRTRYDDFFVDVHWNPRGEKDRRRVGYGVTTREEGHCGSTSRRCDSLEEAFAVIPDVLLEVLL